MEWQGINLNYYRPKLWLAKSLKKVAIVFTTLFLGIISAFGIWQKHLQQTIQNQKIQTEIQQIEKNLANTKQKIIMLKEQGNNQRAPMILKREEIKYFIKLLTELPINGGLDYAQIETDNHLRINLSGKLSANDFSKLEQYLKQKQYPYKVEHLQTNIQHNLEFNLTLSLPK